MYVNRTTCKQKQHSTNAWEVLA